MASTVEILRRAVEDGTGDGCPTSPGELALWTILDLRWPLLGDYFARTPDAVDAILRSDDSPADAEEWLRALRVDEDDCDVLLDVPGPSTRRSAALRRLRGRRPR